MWKCPNCSAETDNERADCSGCGLVRIGPGTNEKYAILRGYLTPLSLIMRNQGYEHYFIDACAGSGMVYDPDGRKMVEGSPIIMAKTREAVQNTIKDKTKPHQVKCICIEVEDKTYAHLRKNVSPFSDFVATIKGDCNEKLDDVLDQISSDVKTKNHFAFVYIDPFGLGKPMIQRKTVERILQRQFTELLIHYNWEGVTRLAGYAKRVDDPNPRVAQTARAYVEDLDCILEMGGKRLKRRTSLLAGEGTNSFTSTFQISSSITLSRHTRRFQWVVKTRTTISSSLPETGEAMR